METQRTLVAVFDDRSQAEKALSELQRAGFNDDKIGIVGRQANQTDPGQAGNKPATNGGEVREQADEAIAADSKTTDRTFTGVVTGGVVGSLVGAAAALLVPGIGPVIAGGILTGVLLGASGGIVAGGILGALTNLGLPENEARYYETEFNAGRTLVTVQAGDRTQEAESILRANGGRQPTGQDNAAQTPLQGGASQDI
jgi:outer membrane lipoprotein SlyB